MNKQTYIVTLQMVIRDLHGCGSTHVATVPVHEVFKGQTVWQGEVEVFDLKDHPKAKRCYAWSHLDKPDDSEERFVAVLQIPPATSPENAVRAAIVNDGRRLRVKIPFPAVSIQNKSVRFGFDSYDHGQVDGIGKLYVTTRHDGTAEVSIRVAANPRKQQPGMIYRLLQKQVDAIKAEPTDAKTKFSCILPADGMRL